MSKVLKAEEADIKRLGKDRHGKTLREITLFSKKYIQSTTLGILGVSHMGFIPWLQVPSSSMSLHQAWSN